MGWTANLGPNIWMIGPIIQMKTFYFQHTEHAEWTHCQRPRLLERVESPREFFDRLYVQLGYKHMDDWYNASQKEIYRLGGSNILHVKYSVHLPKHYRVHIRAVGCYGGFKAVPRGYWEKLGNQRAFVNWLCAKLGYKEMDDWHQLTLEDVYKHGGGRLQWLL